MSENSDDFGNKEWKDFKKKVRFVHKHADNLKPAPKAWLADRFNREYNMSLRPFLVEVEGTDARLLNKMYRKLGGK